MPICPLGYHKVVIYRTQSWTIVVSKKT